MSRFVMIRRCSGRRLAVAVTLTVVASVAGSVLAAPVSAGSAAVAPGASAGERVTPDGALFVPLVPCRVVDTRTGAGPLGSGEQRPFQVSGGGTGFAPQGGQPGGCGVPDWAVAVEASVTAVNPSGNGFLRMWPSDGPAATATFLNFTKGQSITNTGTVGLGADLADLTVKNFGAVAHYVIDVQGYFVTYGQVPPGASDSVFVPINPCRVVDTRGGGGPLGSGATRAFQVSSAGAGFAAQGGRQGGCGVPDAAVAVEASVTAVNPSGTGFLRMWRSGGPAATATFLNFTKDQAITNTGTVGLGSGGKDLTVKNFVATTQYVIDVQGYFVGPDDVPLGSQGAVFVPVGPCRVVDTRAGGGALEAGAQRPFQVGGNGAGFADQGGRVDGCEVPSSAVAVEASVTAVNPSGNGFLRMWPSGGPAATATFLNFTKDQGITNTGATGLGSEVKDLTVRNFSADVQYVIDIQGFFVAPATVLAVAKGDSHSCALRSDGTVDCWGSNNGYGELGNGGGGGPWPYREPVAVRGITGATAIAAAGGRSCALIVDGTVECWGHNPYGQLGNGTIVNSSVPVVVSGITDATAILMTSSETCALLGGGSVSCWGDNYYGQLGDGTTARSSVPVAVVGITDATAISARGNHVCALIAGGSVECWGDNGRGQLGNGTTENSSVPVPVTGLTGATDVAAVGRYSCALLASGGVSCWGDNYYGQLGNSSYVSSKVPVAVTGLADATAISVGGSGACALRAGGTVGCWGNNDRGQLGDGSTTGSWAPVAVTGLTGATEVVTAPYHSCAVVAGGTVECWGKNVDGQLGNATTADSPVPVVATGITTATAVVLGLDHSCAVLLDGGVGCWGDNSVGQLGDGTLTNSSVPVRVVGL